MIKALVVDDEPYCCESLVVLLERYCPEVEVIGVCYNGIEALEVIEQKGPQLLFLDVEMPRMNGFEMLEHIPSVSFDLIFTTSYDQYALKAFRFSALDYLLKPIDREELQKAVAKVVRRAHNPLAEQIQILMQTWNRPAVGMSKIALPTMEGLQMIPVDSLISCQSDRNYTIVCLKNKEKTIVSRNLKEIEEMLEGHGFIRVHHSSLVNLNEIARYIKGEGGYLLMSDGSKIEVSRSRKELLLKKLLPGRY